MRTKKISVSDYISSQFDKLEILLKEGKDTPLIETYEFKTELEILTETYVERKENSVLSETEFNNSYVKENSYYLNSNHDIDILQSLGTNIGVNIAESGIVPTVHSFFQLEDFNLIEIFDTKDYLTYSTKIFRDYPEYEFALEDQSNKEIRDKLVKSINIYIAKRLARYVSYAYAKRSLLSTIEKNIRLNQNESIETKQNQLSTNQIMIILKHFGMLELIDSIDGLQGNATKKAKLLNAITGKSEQNIRGAFSNLGVLEKNKKNIKDINKLLKGLKLDLLD